MVMLRTRFPQVLVVWSVPSNEVMVVVVVVVVVVKFLVIVPKTPERQVSHQQHQHCTRGERGCWTVGELLPLLRSVVVVVVVLLLLRRFWSVWMMF